MSFPKQAHLRQGRISPGLEKIINGCLEHEDTDNTRLNPYFMFSAPSSGSREEAERNTLGHMELIHLQFYSLCLTLDLLIIQMLTIALDSKIISIGSPIEYERMYSLTNRN